MDEVDNFVLVQQPPQRIPIVIDHRFSLMSGEHKVAVSAEGASKSQAFRSPPQPAGPPVTASLRLLPQSIPY
jgi:hypothetical protein